jgi:hypothetical protein
MNLLVGDSHSLWITFKDSIHLLCSAGSAKGLNNPNSISQYNKTIIENIANNSYKNIFFLFGGVDTDFVFIHKYLENPQINYVDFNLDVIKNYLNFIMTNFYDKSVIILSVGLPCLDDENLKKGLLNGHVNHLENKDLTDLENNLSKANLPNIYDRTKITLNFNTQLENEITLLQNPNIKYLDITSFTYDNNLNRIIDPYFSRLDHHNYERNATYTEIINNFLHNHN